MSIMKKIGIDARLYSQTGVGVYIRNLLHFLDKNYLNKNNFFIYLLENDFYKVNFKNKNFIKRKANFFWHSLNEQTGFLNLLNKDDLDLMHFTYFSYPIFYQKRFITTIHDLTPYFFKTGKSSTKSQFIYEIKHQIFKIVLKSQVKNSASIITPTLAVKNQIINEYGNQYEDKIYPVYEGVSYELLEAKENVSLKRKFPDKFFIYVGNFYPHKNVIRLIEAYINIKTDIKLVLIGPRDYFSKRVLQFIDKSKQNKKIIICHYSAPEDLVFFYKNAQALIHPSLSEGFGLPLVEAAHFNLPVIGSNISVFKEILDDQYLSFNPESITDIKDKILSFIEKKTRFDYQKILRNFSFEKMVTKIVDRYKEALNLK